MLAEIDADPEVHAAFGSHAPAMPDDELGHGVPVCREHFDGGDIVGPHQAAVLFDIRARTAASRRSTCARGSATDSSSGCGMTASSESCVRPWPYCRV